MSHPVEIKIYFTQLLHCILSSTDIISATVVVAIKTILFSTRSFRLEMFFLKLFVSSFSVQTCS